MINALLIVFIIIEFVNLVLTVKNRMLIERMLSECIKEMIKSISDELNT